MNKVYYTRLSQMVLPLGPTNVFELVLYVLAGLLLLMKLYRLFRDADKTRHFAYYLGAPPSAKPGGLGAAVLLFILLATSSTINIENWAVPVALIVGYAVKIGATFLLVDTVMFFVTFVMSQLREVTKI